MQTNIADARARILEAMVQVVAERGFADASVALVVTRAKVSRRTFYEQFDDLEDCFAAVLELGLTLPSALIVQAFAREDGWRNGVRAALAVLLEFFDSEPSLTRIWFVEAMAVGSWALEQRERNIAAVQSLIVEHWFPAESSAVDPVLVQGVMASILGTIQTHVVTRRPEPLITLLASLTRLVASPFLDGEDVRAEVERAAELTRKLLAERSSKPAGPAPGLTRIPDALLLPAARRSRQCLRYLAQHPGASNYRVGMSLNITHQSQTSRLLARLAGMGLLVKLAGTPGRPNAWSLTPEGERVVRALAGYQ
jgi:AcrR family transcriptional regulator